MKKDIIIRLYLDVKHVVPQRGFVLDALSNAIKIMKFLKSVIENTLDAIVHDQVVLTKNVNF